MATTVAAPTVYRVTSRVAPVRVGGSGTTITYCYLTSGVTRGTATTLGAIPAGSEIERTVTS
jgi:hypothetical protein